MINWENVYNNLITNSKQKPLIEGQYYEKHHIIPRYAGGDNSNNNLVFLTFREHTLAHFILWRWKGNLEDKIAYKMMSGQTKEGRILKSKLAVIKSNESNKVERVKEIFSDKIKVKNMIEKRKQTRLKNFNNKWYDDNTLSLLQENIKKNYCKIFNSESLKKRSNSMKQNSINMSDEEFYNRYIKPMEGPLHPMYGKKRPGELAGNYGKNKGTYILITPEGQQHEFSGIVKLIKYGVNELIIRKWVNKGVISKSKYGSKMFKWGGYEIKFIPNELYGDINKFQENRKRFKIKK